MSSPIDLAKRVLEIPPVFDLYQALVGGPGCKRDFIRDRVRPQPGQRILDVGCGTGALTPYLPPGVDLLGIDISAAYIEAAHARYGDRGQFRVADAADPELDLGAPFDVAYAFGVLHHIPDAPARRLVDGVMRRLKPGGRFVTIDPTLWEGQGLISRLFVTGDRGQYIRTEAQLASLMSGFAPEIEIVTDTLRIPYAQAVAAIHKS